LVRHIGSAGRPSHGTGRRGSDGSSDEDDSDDDDDEDDDGEDGEDDPRINSLSRQVGTLGMADEGTTPQMQNFRTYTALSRGILKGNSARTGYEKLYPEYKVRRNGAKFFERGKVSLTE
jgi:hypothetical protein